MKSLKQIMKKSKIQYFLFVLEIKESLQPVIISPGKVQNISLSLFLIEKR